MRLVIAQFDYLPDGNGVKVCQPGKTKALARIVPDAQYSAMWRVVRPDGGTTDMVNQARARDMAYGRAETAIYLRMAAESRPPIYGHFSTHTAPPMRPPGLGATTRGFFLGRSDFDPAAYRRYKLGWGATSGRYEGHVWWSHQMET